MITEKPPAQQHKATLAMSLETASGLDFCCEFHWCPGNTKWAVPPRTELPEDRGLGEPSGHTPLPSPPFGAQLDRSTPAGYFLTGISLGPANTLLRGQRTAPSLFRGQAPQKCLQLGPAPHGKGQLLRSVRFWRWGRRREQTGAMR